MSDDATRVIAIRHGQTDWNASALIQGHTDIALNAVGRWQASRLVPALADEAIDAVYASDLGRARETAAPLAQAAGRAVTLEPLLRERGFGAFEGLSFEEIEQRWPDQAVRWRRRDADFAPEGGETLRDFYERAVGIAARLAMAHRGGCIVVVSHGGVLDALYRAATRLALEAPHTWQVGNASINRLLHTEAGFTLVGWADSHHLDGDAAAPGT